MTPNSPIDETHAACLNARHRINEIYLEIRRRIQEWQPRPYPKEPT